MQQALCAVSVAAVLCVCAVQWHLAGAPAALTARWTNDYQSLLNREASTLPGVDIARADAPGGIERENDAMLASARKEQDEYMKENDAEALAQAKDTVQMAREINAKFGGSFHNGIGSNTWAGTPYAKYDNKDLRTEALSEESDRAARLQILALTAARVKADRKAAAEAASKKAQTSARKAKAACHGNSQCEQVLNQVMGIFHFQPT